MTEEDISMLDDILKDEFDERPAAEKVPVVGVRWAYVWAGSRAELSRIGIQLIIYAICF